MTRLCKSRSGPAVAGLALLALCGVGGRSADGDDRPPRISAPWRIELPALSSVGTNSNGVVVRIWKGADIPRRHEVHELVGTDGMLTDWRYYKAVGTNLVSMDMSTDRHSFVWHGINSLGVQALPDQSDLPDDGATVLDGVRYTVEIRSSDGQRTYAYANPSSHDRSADRTMAAIAQLVYGFTDSEAETGKWIQAVKTHVLAIQGERCLDHLVGTTFDDLLTATRGSFRSAHIIDRRGRHLIVQHTKGTSTISAREILNIIFGDPERVQPDGSTVPSGAHGRAPAAP